MLSSLRRAVEGASQRLYYSSSALLKAEHGIGMTNEAVIQFLSKDQLTKMKDRFLIKDLISNK